MPDGENIRVHPGGDAVRDGEIVDACAGPRIVEKRVGGLLWIQTIRIIDCESSEIGITKRVWDLC